MNAISINIALDKTSLRQIKRSKNANHASELFVWDISGNSYLIHHCLNLFSGWPV